MITLMVLALEALFIFRPLEGLVNKKISQIQKDEYRMAESWKEFKAIFENSLPERHAHRIKRVVANLSCGSLQRIAHDVEPAGWTLPSVHPEIGKFGRDQGARKI